MNVKIIRNTVAGGSPVFVGDVVDLPEQEAKYLIGIGKAEKLLEAETRSAISQKVEREIETADLAPKFEKAVKPSIKKGA